MRKVSIPQPRCSYCGQKCYAFGFKGELVGGCQEMKSYYAIEHAKKIFNTKTNEQLPENNSN